MSIKQKGDTIIEVMLATVILSAALGSAFAMSSSSFKATQANHDRYQAQLYANEQAEMIRVASNSFDDREKFMTEVSSAGSTFCINTTDNKTPVPSTNINCKRDANLFNISVTPFLGCKEISILVTNGCDLADSTKTELNTYVIEVTWDSIKGGTERLELVYGI